MNFEQIMIRLGIDATAVKSGLANAGNTIKGQLGQMKANISSWSTSIQHDLKGMFGRMLLLGEVIKVMNETKQKILEIQHAASATGASTNFLQGMMHEAEKSGISFESMVGGISRFNKTLGAAKSGSTEEIKKLHDMGIATDRTMLSTLTFSGAMHNLAVKYDSLNDKQKQAYLLSQAFGKSYAEMIPLFEKGAAGIDAMQEGNFFTKIQGSSINDLQKWYGGIKSVGMVVGATLTNIVGSSVHGIKLLSQTLGLATKGVLIGTDEYANTMDEMNKDEDGREQAITFEKNLQNEADKEGISLSEKKQQILNEQTDLLEKQAELSATIADRDKDSVSSMAAKARAILHQKSPEDRLHTVTPAARIALQVDTLEQRAHIASQYNRQNEATRLQNEADRIRSNPANAWAFKRGDQNPMHKTESELQRVNEKLAPVSEMAKLINVQAAK